MIVTIISKNYGSQKINLGTYNPMFAAKNSTAFKIVEHIFNAWFEHNTQPGAPLARDRQAMYLGEHDQPAIYSKTGAIRQGIENMIEYISGSGKSLFTTRDIMKMDIESAFE